VLDDSEGNMIKMNLRRRCPMAVQEQKGESSFDRYIAEVRAATVKIPSYPTK
jgi:hypothetical protein